jgi:preprotein translocase subunit SecA
LHQAVEEYAGVPLSDEKSSAGRITRQSYYQLYSSLCGMTGTAEGAEQEFRQIYGLSTVRIPLNRPTKRVKQPDRFFSSTDAKFDAIIEEALTRHRAGQPVLIGTRTISDSERLSERLKSAAVSHVVLNGKQDQEEAQIVAEAGRRGRITVATNMAGRGTDIKPDPAAIEAGGLHVIGVERHESRRIDGQLAGRAARAGAPGSFRFFVSAEDDLIQHNAASMARRWKQQTTNRGEIIRDFSAQVEQVQIACERAAFHQRQLMIQQDRGMQELLSALCYRTKE